jgi:hypothetical protein
VQATNAEKNSLVLTFGLTGAQHAAPLHKKSRSTQQLV